MANKKNNKDNNEAVKKQIIELDDGFKKAISNLSTNIIGVSNNHAIELQKLNKEVDNIINSELNDTKSVTSDDMSTFLVKLFNENDNKVREDTKTLNDLFESDSSNIFQFFQQRYHNTNLLYEDLEMLSTQLYELEEAISTTRDAIITSEDISATISRTLSFKNSAGNDNIQDYIKTINEIETKYNLQNKIKNMITMNTLRYGNYYAYCVPYSVLFQEQYDNREKNDKQSTTLSESIDQSFIDELSEEFDNMHITVTTENLTNKTKVKSKLLDITKGYANNISIINETHSIPLIEGVDISELIDNEEFSKKKTTIMKQSEKQIKQQFSSDGVVDSKKKKGNNFDDVTGVYLKFIDPKKLIPIKILEHTVGYYYIHESAVKVNKSPFTNTIKITNTNGQPYQADSDVESMFITKITDRIVKSFDKKFLETNMKFKELIFNALQYNSMYEKQIKFQFIPADYIVEFKVNEDPDGNGQSILNRSLFYAKLYLALLVFKMVSVVTRSNDKRVYYVKNSGLDSNITNKVQEVARSVKNKQINIMDIMNYNSIISKIGAFKDDFIPIGRSGEKGIDFDILSGQDVQLNTDFMEMLRTNMINGTGVPSVIMSYINEADYAKTLTMANSKFIGRVISYQLDFDKSITKLYKMILKHSNSSIPEELIDRFEFKFNAPKSLNLNNMGDVLNTSDQLINYIIKILTGENADQTDDNNKVKDNLYKILSKYYLPMLDWSTAEKAYEDAKIQLAKDQLEKKVNNTDNDSNYL